MKAKFPQAFAAVAIVLALFTATALAQTRSQTFYDSSGRVTGRSTTDSAGSTTFYDASGRVIGRSSTSSNGTTTIYDAAGRKTGTVTQSGRK